MTGREKEEEGKKVKKKKEIGGKEERKTADRLGSHNEPIRRLHRSKWVEGEKLTEGEGGKGEGKKKGGEDIWSPFKLADIGSSVREGGGKEEKVWGKGWKGRKGGGGGKGKKGGEKQPDTMTKSNHSLIFLCTVRVKEGKRKRKT